MKPKKLNKQSYILQDDRRIEEVFFSKMMEFQFKEERRSTPHNYNGTTKTLLIELDPQPRSCHYPSSDKFIPDCPDCLKIFDVQFKENEIVILEDDWFTDYDHSGGATTDLSRMQEYYGPEDVLPSTTMPSHLNNFKIIHIIGVESLLPEYWEPGYSHYESDKKWFLKTIVEIEDE